MIAIYMGDGPTERVRAFRHEALLYGDREDFVAGVTDFVADGLVRGEPAVIAVSGDKIDALSAVLGDQKGISFVDMDDAGRNPACLIPTYHDFIMMEAANGPCRGVGEPIGSARQGAELAECEIHESLCNLAFTTTSWWVLCPYDTSTLDQAVIDEACRNHPILLEKGARRASSTYQAPMPSGPLGDPLPEPPEDAHRLEFTAGSLHGIRQRVSDHASAGLGSDRVTDLLVAVDEIVANTLRHATGEGCVSIWTEGSAVVVDVRDRGRIADPLVGRRPLATDVERNPGLRIVNKLCDLVQVRSGPSGTTVRVHMGV